MRFQGAMAWHEYEGVAMDTGERERLVTNIGTHDVLVLRNHGVLACGRSIPEAYINHHFFELACQGQVAALSAGGPDALLIPTDDCAERAAVQAAKAGHRDENHRDWAALLRLADRLDPSYRN